MLALIRLLLPIAALVLFALLVATHGIVRSVFIAVAVTLLITVPRTRAWKTGERWLVRLTGSRRRAAAVAMFMVIGTVAAVNIYHLTH